jgi:lysozyme
MSRSAIVLVMFVAGVWFVLSRAGGRGNSAYDVADVGASLALANLTGGSVVNMTLSAAGLNAIASREGGFKPFSYPDADGRSIGYGHFVQLGESFVEPITQQQGYDLLISDTGIAIHAVQAYVKVPLNQNQFDALVSFAYNAGTSALKTSTLLRLLNAGDFSGAAAQFPAWDKKHVDGVLVVAPELIARRTSEQQQFLA